MNDAPPPRRERNAYRMRDGRSCFDPQLEPIMHTATICALESGCSLVSLQGYRLRGLEMHYARTELAPRPNCDTGSVMKVSCIASNSPVTGDRQWISYA